MKQNLFLSVAVPRPQDSFAGWLLVSLVWCGAGLSAEVSVGGNDGPRTFCVDSETGQDSGDGRSPDHAWRSLDRVNSAELKPGDTVRFKCGGTWRGSLVPASGDEAAPIRYTSFGQGPKPTILGSVPRNRPEDWVKVGENLWSTLPGEYWNNPETAVTRNIRFVNNTCVNAGGGWAHAQRPDRNGSHLMFYTNTAATSGLEIKYNIFCDATDWGSRYSSGWRVLPEMDFAKMKH
ncbi:MAG: hypothetical protein NTY19_50790 [Planctomycetota bacterium]|nr:hypothetical protein [Planctomycetota bacterium]